MASPTTSGLSQDKAGNRYLRVALPGHSAFVLARFENGTVGTIPLKLDTLIVDMPAMQITQVWRATIMRTHPLRMLELRMKLNRNALPTSMVIYQKEPGE